MQETFYLIVFDGHPSNRNATWYQESHSRELLEDSAYYWQTAVDSEGRARYCVFIAKKLSCLPR